MKVAVWDTYVYRNDQKVMHFDILVPQEITDQSLVLSYGSEYLAGKPFGTSGIKTQMCNFCHIEKVEDAVEQSILENNYAIIELSNCE